MIVLDVKDCHHVVVGLADGNAYDVAPEVLPYLQELTATDRRSPRYICMALVGGGAVTVRWAAVVSWVPLAASGLPATADMRKPNAA